MTRQEVVNLVRAITATYPSFKSDNITDTVNAWFMFLEMHDYKAVLNALNSYVQNSGSDFAPTPSRLIEIVRKNNSPEMSEMEAWSKVRKAINRATYYAQEEFEKLPADIQRALGTASCLRQWAQDENFNDSVVQSNFLRSYRQVIENKKFIFNNAAKQRIETQTREALNG